MKLTRLVVLGFPAVALVVALLVVARSPKDFPQTKRLPDGSYLKVVLIGHGTNHTFALPPHPAWKGFLLTHLPRSWTARLGWWAGGGSVGVSHTPADDGLAVFTVCEMASSSSFTSSPQLSLCNEAGALCDSTSESSVAACFDGKRDWKLVGWRLSNVPRNSKQLRLRFSELLADGKTRQPVAEFLIANPLARQADK